MTEAEINFVSKKSVGDIVIIKGEEHYVRNPSPPRLAPIWDLTSSERKKYDNTKTKQKEEKQNG